MELPVILKKRTDTMNHEEYREISEKNRLENGLELIIFSHFIHTAGDRCQVTFEAVIDMDIKEEFFKDQALNDLDMNKVVSILGDKTIYRYVKTRNFIAEDEKEKIFGELKQQFLDNTLPYISSQSFPAKLIKRNYTTAEKEEMIRRQREAYMKGV
jgi:hypothetical protein